MLHHQCSPYHSQSAFFPVIEQIEQAAQLTAREADADKIAKLEAYFRRSTDSPAEPVLLIANLLSISTENHRELSELTPQQIKNRTISTLVDTLLAISVQRPTVCIFEDAHWLDPSTLELLELIVSRIDHARRVAYCVVPARVSPRVDHSCEHHHVLAHSIVAHRSEGR